MNFQDRKRFTDEKFGSIQSHLEETLRACQDEFIGDHTFVYATGSCGRGDMGTFSDLDPYVVRIGEDNSEHDRVIHEALVAANAAAGLPTLDADGKHARAIQAHHLIDRLGAPEDDSREDGVFTKRMLLLLESRVLLGEAAYDKVLEKIISAYWQNANIHTTDYQPFVLVNDIVRWWRIVLLNHESRLRKEAQELEAEGELSPAALESRLLASRRYRSYKMRLARCLTCFSALTYLLALTPSEDAHVTKDSIYEMVELTPLQRLEALETLADRQLSAVRPLLSTYAVYLDRMDLGKHALIETLQVDEKLARALSAEGGQFTKRMFELVEELGGGRRLHRHMLV